MRVIGLLAATIVFYALTVLLVGWPALQELRRTKNWNVYHVDQPTGELHGVEVSIDQARAMILPQRPDRALIYLRLGLQGDSATMKAWLACDLGLTDNAGRKWLPMYDEIGTEIVKVMGDGDSGYGNNCGQSLVAAEGETGPSYSEQAFLVPVDMLDQLRMEISGMSTRPDALSLPFKPVLRPAP